MIELKREVNQLLGGQGEVLRYDLSFDDPDRSTADGVVSQAVSRRRACHQRPQAIGFPPFSPFVGLATIVSKWWTWYHLLQMAQMGE